MRAFINFRSVCTAAFVFGALAIGTASSAQAGGYGHGGYGHGGYGHGGYNYQPQYYWKTVTTYETVKKSYVDYVTRYDHCGHAYQAELVRYEYVQIPVYSKVKVYY